MLTVKITTANTAWAGTDDTVKIHLGGKSWKLDNAWRNDFERGRTDTFDLPETKLDPKKIKKVKITKSKDGIGGGWKLKGVKVIAKGRTVYDNQSINKWFEKNNRTWEDKISIPATLFNPDSKFAEYPYMQARYHSSRRGKKPSILVMHYTTGSGDADKLGKQFARNRRASAHFGISRKPDKYGDAIYQYVDTARNAWHPGDSRWKDKKGNIGVRSIGVEFCNRGFLYKGSSPFIGSHRNPRQKKTKWEPYTQVQKKSAIELVKKLKKEYPTLKYVTGHEDITNPYVYSKLKGSKSDPGPAFPWSKIDWKKLGLTQVHFDFKSKKWREGNP